MPSPAPLSQPFAGVPLAIQQQIVANVYADAVNQVPFDPAFVRIAASDRYKIPVGEPRFVYIRVYQPVPITNTGGQRLNFLTRRIVRIYLYSRSNVDVYGEDTAAMTAEAQGHLYFEEQVLNWLVDWFPVDPNGKFLTVEPLHPLDPAEGPPERIATVEDAGFLRSTLDFEVLYTLNIDRTDPQV